MSTPKHQILFGAAQVKKETENNVPPEIENPPVPDLTPIGWTWDSEIVKFDSERRTLDEGYSTEQLIYILSQ